MDLYWFDICVFYDAVEGVKRAFYLGGSRVRFSKQSRKQLFVLMMSGFVAATSGCSSLSSAKYRSWSDADRYFSHPSSPHHLATSTCHSGYYQVQKGDSVFKIARKCGVASYAIINANALLPPFRLQVGQSLKLPRTLSLANRQFLAHQQPPKAPWQLPVDDKVSGQFTVKSNRLWLSVSKPAEVMPVAAGKVVYVGDHVPGYGLVVMVKHADGYLSVYTHLAAVTVKKGVQVSAQTPLGFIVKSPPPIMPFVEARYLGRKVPIYPLLEDGKISASTTSRSSVVKTL